MKKTLSVAACVLALTVMVSGMAYAEDGGFYGSIKGGYSFFDASDSFNTNATDATGASDDFDDGYSIGIAAGWNWMDHDLPIRTEIEYMYKADFEYEYSDSNATFTNDIDIHTLMLNVYWDFYNSTSFTPYINGGVGVAWIQEDFSTAAGTATLTAPGDETSTNFAFNVGAGVGWSMTDSIILDLAYRYNYYGDGEEVTATGTPQFDSQIKDLATHDILLGLRYQF